MANIISKFQKPIRSVCSSLPAKYVRLIERIIEFLIKWKYYSFSYKKETNTDLICIVSGWFNNGGLTDRINGIIAAYQAADASGRKFKLLFDKPFNLSEYLIPNKVNWSITADKISFGWNVKPVFIRAFNRSMPDRLKQLINTASHYKNKQLHVFTNIACNDVEIYHHCYHNLFKPSERLEELILKELERIKENFISVTFRFQQLLGDFKEGNYPILSHSESELLINKCIENLENIHLKNPNKLIVVTSDSMTFLNKIHHLHYIKILSGKVVHMQYTKDNSFSVHAKAFIDLYVIANAEKIYLVINSPMHDSGFPKLASKIYKKPFIKVINGKFLI